MGKEAADPGNGYETVMLLTKEFLYQSFNNNLSAVSNFFDQQKKAHARIEDCIDTTAIKTLGTS